MQRNLAIFAAQLARIELKLDQLLERRPDEREAPVLVSDEARALSLCAAIVGHWGDAVFLASEILERRDDDARLDAALSETVRDARRPAAALGMYLRRIADEDLAAGYLVALVESSGRRGALWRIRET